jgi:fatty acid desaturase
MTEVNDPLINSVSLRVPKILDVLHCNFSDHTEHHIFPLIDWAGETPVSCPLVREM